MNGAPVTDTNGLAATALSLTPAEAYEVLRELLLEADLRAGAAHAGSDVAARIEDDAAFLREVLRAAGISPETGPSEASVPVPVSPQRLLSAIITEVPAVSGPVREALASLEDRETSLDLGSAIDTAAIAIATSAAIIRPLITYEREKDGETTRFKLDVRGIPDFGAVLRALLPFLPGGKDGNP